VKSTKELVMGKLYCVANPNERYYQESQVSENLKLGYFLSHPTNTHTRLNGQSQRFFLFLGVKSGEQYLFLTGDYKVWLRPGGVKSLKEVSQ
jgi:hypothetical protein